MNWYDAKEYCESLNGFLAEIHNAETQNLLATHAATLTTANWWLGATDEENVSTGDGVICQTYCYLLKHVIVSQSNDNEVQM